MNCSSLSPPPRKNSERSSKSSNSFSRIGMMCPGTFSRTSGFSREPRRPFFGTASVLDAVGSIEPTNITKPPGVYDFLLAGGHIRVVDDRAAFRLELKTRFRPGDQAALDRVRVPAGGGESLGRGTGSVARSAVDDNRLVLVEPGRLALEVRQRNVARGRNVAGAEFDVGADVHRLASGLDDLLRLRGADFRHDVQATERRIALMASSGFRI